MVTPSVEQPLPLHRTSRKWARSFPCLAWAETKGAVCGVGAASLQGGAGLLRGARARAIVMHRVLFMATAMQQAPSSEPVSLERVLRNGVGGGTHEQEGAP